MYVIALSFDRCHGQGWLDPQTKTIYICLNLFFSLLILLRSSSRLRKKAPAKGFRLFTVGRAPSLARLNPMWFSQVGPSWCDQADMTQLGVAWDSGPYLGMHFCAFGNIPTQSWLGGLWDLVTTMRFEDVPKSDSVSWGGGDTFKNLTIHKSHTTPVWPGMVGATNPLATRSCLNNFFLF